MAKVTITAGHSNTDPGAVAGNVTEAEITTDMRNIVAYCLIFILPKTQWCRLT